MYPLYPKYRIIQKLAYAYDKWFNACVKKWSQINNIELITP